MATSKYTDPAVQNTTQDRARDRVDDIHQRLENPGRNKNKGNNSDAKKKGYREGNKDDSILDEHGNNSNGAKRSSYGKRL